MYVYSVNQSAPTLFFFSFVFLILRTSRNEVLSVRGRRQTTLDKKELQAYYGFPEELHLAEC